MLAHIKNHIQIYGKGHNALYQFLPIIFFWALFDAFVAYSIPNFLVSAGFSVMIVGLIISTSSLWGAIFDFVLANSLRNKGYKSLFSYLFLLCYSVPLFLYLDNSLIIYLIVMAIWGLYYDLYVFGLFNFIGRNFNQNSNVSCFGLVDVIKSIAIVIAPIIIGIEFAESENFNILLLMIIVITLSVISFVFHNYIYRGKIESNYQTKKELHSISIFKELKIWLKVEKFIYPVLILVTFLNIIDAFFWTLGPIIASNLSNINHFGGLVISAYIFPSLFVGGFSQKITQKYGKKRTAFFSTLISSILMLFMYYVESSIILIFIIFISSIFNSIAWPALKGALADYIFESGNIEKEIEGIQDFSSNLGYIIGPILAGLFATIFGNIKAFGVIGLIGVFISILLIIITPKHIRIKISSLI